MHATEVAEAKDVELERGDWTSDDMEDDDVGTEEKTTNVESKGEIVEPYVGMEFESEDAARRFYHDYAKKEGFVVRVMQRRRSETNGKTVARRLSCNKEVHLAKRKAEQETKGDPNERDGCKATLQFKLDKSGKWVITRFVKEHNHPLIVASHESKNPPDKDKRIQELTRDLMRQEEMYAAYRDNLVNLLANIENRSEHMNMNVLAVVQNVRQAEAEALSKA